MAAVHFCNGCGKTVTDDQHPDATDTFHEVMVTRATLAGTNRGFGLASDEKTVGELCDICWEAVRNFVAPTGKEASEAARDVIAPRTLAAAV